MGNLLGSPITTKDTHVGKTHLHRSNGGDGQQLHYGISSMQGWRIHMEDAHIAQPFLFAERRGDDHTYIKLPLPNHSLFAVFDGHGGSFAAEYASRNLLRILSRQRAFIAYAERWTARDAYFAKLNDDATASTGDTEMVPEVNDKELNDKERFNRLRERGRESDEKVKQIKEKVHRHLHGEDISYGDTGSAQEKEQIDSNSLEKAKAAYDRELMTVLEYALCDTFCDVDAEILREVLGTGNVDSNLVYGEGYCPDTSADIGVGHLPKESNLEEDKAFDDAKDIEDSDHNPAETETTTPPSLDEEDSGTTAIVVLLTPKWIVCANSGDSRAVYSRSNHRAVPLSYDHKPEDENEERRIRDAGGYVSGGRVEGDLAVSRGLGDFRFKDIDVVMSAARGENRDRRNDILVDSTSIQNEQPLPVCKPSSQKVSPVPDIIVQNRNENEDEFIVIACDGIWDVQTNQECVQMVADIFSEGEADMGLICEEILDLCLIKGSKDNMTAAVIRFPKQVTGTGGGVLARRELRGENDDDTEGLREYPTPNPYVPMRTSDDDMKIL